jgi:hypothetical protein
MYTFLDAGHNYIGICGVFMVLFAYFSMQVGKMAHNSVIFSAMNLVGSAFIMVSLYFDVNIASVVIEIAWLLISMFGLYKAVLLKRNSNAV